MIGFAGLSVSSVSFEPVLNLLAIVGHLVFGLAVLSARTHSGVKQPLVALCFTHFGWSFASVAFRTTGNAPWHHLDVSISVSACDWRAESACR